MTTRQQFTELIRARHEFDQARAALEALRVDHVQGNVHSVAEFFQLYDRLDLLAKRFEDATQPFVQHQAALASVLTGNPIARARPTDSINTPGL